MARLVIRSAALVVAALVVGAMFGIWLGHNPATLSPGAYVEQQQEAIRTMNVSMPALGSTGPHRHYRGHGSYFQSRAGLDSLVGFPGREIVDLGFAFPDGSCNPGHAAVALLAALHYRKRTGRGQRVELRQFESTINYMGVPVLDYAANGRLPRRMGNRAVHAAPHGVYPCEGDDTWCAITVETEVEWRGFSQATGHQEWAHDPRFATLEARKANEDALDKAVSEWSRRNDPYAAMECLQRCGVSAGVVQHAGDLIERDPQMAHREFYVELEHAEIGPLLHESFSFRLSQTPARLREAAPLLGQHNDYVLQEVLGLSEAEVNAHIVAGAVS